MDTSSAVIVTRFRSSVTKTLPDQCRYFGAAFAATGAFSQLL